VLNFAQYNGVENAIFASGPWALKAKKLSMPRGRCISQLQIQNRLVHRTPLAKAIVRP
jgi:hypothetical protein